MLARQCARDDNATMLTIIRCNVSMLIFANYHQMQNTAEADGVISFTGITKVIPVLPEGDMNIWNKFHASPHPLRRHFSLDQSGGQPDKCHYTLPLRLY